MPAEGQLTPVQRIDPRPRQRLTDAGGTGGRIKVRPEDFIVEERPRYEPTGSGEHLFLRVRKVGLSHGEAVDLLARHFGVSHRAIGFAGMKDKYAVTTQSMTVHTPRNCTAGERIHERLEVLWSARHANKIRRGHLLGNRFVIRIREVDPLRAPQGARSLERLERSGAPNYFGEQRFGYRLNNHILGALLLRRQWREFLDELLGTRGAPFPAHQRESRELFDQGDYAGALDRWSAGYRAERVALREVRRGQASRRAVLALGRSVLSFHINAAQSAVFNRLLDERIGSGTFDELVAGDLAWKHDSRSVFPVTEEDLHQPEFIERLRRLEISPSGPMWGPGMLEAGGSIAERERRALAWLDLSPQNLEGAPSRLTGVRRAFRVRIENAQIESGLDEHGAYIRVAFDLERGAYATMVMREIMGEADKHEGTRQGG